MMANGIMKAKVSSGSVWAGSERRGGERSEPPRSGEPAQTVASETGGLRPEPEAPERPTRRRFTAEYKEQIVRQAAECSEPGQIGALLRREGLYSSHLDKWRKKLAQGGREALVEKRGRKATRTAAEVELEKLRKRNARLEKRLKQAETIIEIQKKVAEMLGTPLAQIDDSEGDN
mgnify:CR=1 FL=1